MMLLGVQNDKEKRYFSPFCGNMLIPENFFPFQEKKKKFSEMLIGTKFLDKKKE